MGKKGDKMTSTASVVEEEIMGNLDGIGELTSKKMFGGYGLFHESKMFGMVNSKGICFFKADDNTKDDYLDLDGEKHSRMPYYSIPTSILEDRDQLKNWAKKAIEISKG